MTLDQIAQAASQLGAMGFLIVALLGLYRQWWVPGWTYREKAAEAEKWQDLALKGMQTAADTAEAAAQHTTLTPQQAKLAQQLIRSASRDGADDEA